MAQIELLEALSIPGSPDRENDDAMGTTSSIAFVLDGVTSLVDQPLMSGRSDAAWVAHLARDLMLHHKPGAGGDIQDLIRNVATEITRQFEAQRSRPPSARHELPWTTLSMIGVEPGRINIAFVGDSRVLIEADDDSVHNFGTTPSRGAFETKLAQKMISAGKGIGIEAQRATVQLELRRAREFVNTTEGYWLLGADARVADHLNTASLELRGPATVLLATDGFYALVEDYHRYGDRELIATAQVVGLKTLARELRHLEDADPEGKHHPRMKKSDDATAVLVRVTP
ncbi:MAG: protein phosphatase 2C domain-containing protein [Micropepsaceae bacterium]